MIQTVDQFIQYFESVRRRTLNYLQRIPPSQLGWAPKEGEFSAGEIVSHLAAAERMFTGVVVEGRWLYSGHTLEPGASLESLLAQLNESHAGCMERLRGLSDADLLAPRPSLQGPEIKTWRWLMAMVEHEVHHRSQVAVYMTLMGITPPHVFGLGVEDLIALATG
jgi:uncharacterized damage-inducible protein DinB